MRSGQNLPTRGTLMPRATRGAEREVVAGGYRIGGGERRTGACTRRRRASGTPLYKAACPGLGEPVGCLLRMASDVFID
jgi:hypothetical protein